MKKFILGLIVGAMFSSGVAFGANQIYEATRSSNTFYVDGKWQLIESYVIHDNNFIMLRDLGKYIDFGVEYDGETNSVYIDTTGAYESEPEDTPTPTAETDVDKAIAPFIASISSLSTEQKLREMADYLCDRMTYDYEYAKAVVSNVPYYNPKSTYEAIFIEGNGEGICSTYTSAFNLLCKKAGIPSITVSDADHAWNEVYVGDMWKIIDVTNYDTSRSDTWFLTDYSKYPKQDGNPQRTAERKTEALK